MKKVLILRQSNTTLEKCSTKATLSDMKTGRKYMLVNKRDDDNSLTIGKFYLVERSNDWTVVITDDDGITRAIYKNQFIDNYPKRLDILILGFVMFILAGVMAIQIGHPIFTIVLLTVTFFIIKKLYKKY